MSTATNAPAFDRIKDDIAQNPVTLFMKGTPVFPQCGFSAAVVQILTHLGVNFYLLGGVEVTATNPKPFDHLILAALMKMW